MWRKIRRIPPSTLGDVHIYLVTGINKRTSNGSRSRLLKWAIYFKLSNKEMILETNIPPPDLIDLTTQHGVLDSNEMRTYKVVYDEKEAIEIIKLYYTTVYAGEFRELESLYRSLAGSTIGISRSLVAKMLHTMESKQITHSTNQNTSQPIITTKVMECLQIDLIDYSKSNLPSLNANTNYILSCIDCFSKFLWVFPLKNKSSAVVANALQNLFCNEGV